MKRLYKSKNNKIFCGVIGGLGEYFDVAPVLFRLIWLMIVVFTALVPGIFIYLTACLIVPSKPREK